MQYLFKFLSEASCEIYQVLGHLVQCSEGKGKLKMISKTVVEGNIFLKNYVFHAIWWCREDMYPFILSLYIYSLYDTSLYVISRQFYVSLRFIPELWGHIQG